MISLRDGRRKFSNSRQWRDFVAAVHESVSYPCAATYPKVIGALRGPKWLGGDSACGEGFTAKASV